MSKHYIVMADIIKSRNYTVENIHQPFDDLVAHCNKEFSKHIFFRSNLLQIHITNLTTKTFDITVKN